MSTDLSPAEREEREVERLINKKPAPSRKHKTKRGPKHDNRRRRIKVDDPDMSKSDRDMSLNYKSSFWIHSISHSIIGADKVIDSIKSIESDLRSGSEAVRKAFSKDYYPHIKDDVDDYLRLRHQNEKSDRPDKSILKQMLQKRKSISEALKPIKDNFLKYSKIKFRGSSPDKILDDAKKVWSIDFPGSYGARAGFLYTIRNSIDSFDYSKPVKDALARDPNDSKSKVSILKQFIRDKGSTFNDPKLLEDDFVTAASLSSVYKILSENPPELDIDSIKKRIDNSTKIVYEQAQELAVLGSFMSSWMSASRQFEGVEEFDYELNNHTKLMNTLNSFLSRKKTKEDLIDAKSVGKALAKSIKSRFNKVPKYLEHFANSQSSNEESIEGMSKTASYHGILPQGHPEAPFPGPSIEKRYLGKEQYDSIISSAKEWLKSDWLKHDWESGMAEAPFRAALDLAIYTADNSSYQSKIDAPTYEMLLNKLTSAKVDLFSDTYVPQLSRTSSMNRDAIKNMLKIASELRKTNPKVALEIAHNLNKLAQTDESQVHQSQQVQQSGVKEEMEKDLSKMDPEDRQKLLEDLGPMIKKLMKAEDLTSFFNDLDDVKKHLKVGSRTASDHDLSDIIDALDKLDEDGQKALLDALKKDSKPLEKLEDNALEITDEDIAAFGDALDKIFDTAETAVKKVSSYVNVSLSTLIRVAHENPNSRAILLPVILSAKKKVSEKSKKNLKDMKKKEEESKKDKKPLPPKKEDKSKKPPKKSSKRKISSYMMSFDDWTSKLYNFD